MRIINYNNHTYYFSIIHVVKTENNKLKYDIRLDTSDYILCKSVDLSDCEQLDHNPPLDPGLVEEICKVLTDVETAYEKTPSIEYINSSLFAIVRGARGSRQHNF